MLSTMVATLMVGLSKITHVLQYMTKQPWKQQWNNIGSLQFVLMNFLLKVEESSHNQVMWPKIEALRYPK